MKKKSTTAFPIAFTLIELMVVVTIIGVLASVVVPLIVKTGSSLTAKSAAMERMRREQHGADPGEMAAPGMLPIIHSLDLDLVLTDQPQRVGLEVYNRFLLRGEGTIVIEAPRDSGGITSLMIPFPEGTIEAADVYLGVNSGAEDGGGAVSGEPEEVQYTQDGIYWTSTLEPGKRVEAEIRFTTLGTERLEWSLPPSRRLKDIRLSLDLTNTAARSVTSFSLSPSQAEDGGMVHWEYQNLVSDRHIVVELPGAESPSGRLLQLLHFMAVAVLMFGGGFLYMNERDCPGRLDEFRLGHFSLLAAIYSIFFIVFAVIIYREQIGVVPALLISAVSSLPLLVMYVARIADFRFALRYILPLAVLTLAIVVNGVYGGSARDYVFLGVLVVSVTYLTLTYGVPGGKTRIAQGVSG